VATAGEHYINQKATTRRWRARRACVRRTDDGLPTLLYFERTFAVPDQKREVEQVLDRLRKVVRVDEEPEKVDRAVLFHEQPSNLNKKKGRCSGEK
jgi:hypothetical protein